MRGRLAGISRRLEAERRKRDESAPVADLAQNELWAVAYRLQSRRQPQLAARVREVEAERLRRLRESTP